MFRVFEQYFTTGMSEVYPTERGEMQPRINEVLGLSNIDVVYDMVAYSRDERRILEIAKEFATQRVTEDYKTLPVIMEVVELDLQPREYSGLYKTIVRAVIHINFEGRPIHSFFIEEEIKE